MFNGKPIKNEPHFRARPDFIPKYHKYSSGAFNLFASKSMLQKMIAHAVKGNRCEIIGTLIGRPFYDTKGYYSILTNSALAPFADGTYGTVTTTFKDEQFFKWVQEAYHPTEDILGWYHSHPMNLEGYSSVDRGNQSKWIEPYQIGLLVVCNYMQNKFTVMAYRGPESELLLPSYSVYKGGPEIEQMTEAA